MDYKKYFISLRPLILFSFFIFLFSLVYGYISAVQAPEQAVLALQEFKEMFGGIMEYSPLGQFILISLNNLVSLLLTITLGVAFGIFPTLSLFSNGSLLGVFAYLWVQEMPLTGFFAGILPHGIVEIPILLIGAAIGLRLGRMTAEKFLFKLFPNWAEKSIKQAIDEKGALICKKAIKSELNLGIKFSAKYLVGLLIAAAAIEVFITPLLF